MSAQFGPISALQPTAVSSMTTGEFLTHLRRLEVKLSANGDRIRLSGQLDSLTTELRGELVRRKSELLTLLNGATETSGRKNSIPIASREVPLPLSYAQQRLWFLNQLDSDLPTYNISTAFRSIGALNIEAMRSALLEVVRRHEILRTTFSSNQGQPFQRINVEHSFDVNVRDIAHLPGGTRDAEAERLVKQEARRSFNLELDCMLRAQIVRLDNNLHILQFTMHHIASDGTSLPIFYNEVSELYYARVVKVSSPLPDLTIQYADYAAWQKDVLTEKAIGHGLAYWREKLSGQLPVLKIPSDFSRPPIQSYEGAKETTQFSVDLLDALKALSRLEGATLFMTLAAAFKTLLFRYTEQSDILIGVPFSERDDADTEKLIGFFVNTIVLRTDLAGEPAFRELLGRVRNTTLDAFAHHETPFDILVAQLQSDRNRNNTPLFQVGFSLRNEEAENLELYGLNVKPYPFDDGTSKFDLSLHMIEAKTGLKAVIEYRTDLFLSETIKRMLEHFKVLLEDIVNNPDTPVQELKILTASERRKVLIDWNNTGTSYPKHNSIHELFSEQAGRTPDAVAITFQKQQMSYAILEQRSNQLANLLLRKGVVRGSCVGLCMDRSTELVVAMLGILKAGAAYVPLDPTYPKERIRYMLSDARVCAVVGHPQLMKDLPHDKIMAIVLDLEELKKIQGSSASLESEGTPDDLAYVMYTSGSTGSPKGVAIPHRGVVRLVKNTNFAAGDPDEVYFLGASISFDASTFEIWAPLLNGGRLVIPMPGLLTVSELGEAIRINGVTTLWLTAGLFHLMVDTRLEDLKGLRQLLAGGDVLSVPHVDRFTKSSPHCRMINGYGPTENTTFTCCHTVNSGNSGSNSIPIGRPISNTRVYILDRNLRPVPIGVPGELYTGGDGLAVGYLNQPELTEKKFIPLQLPEIHENRVYKTGDRVRYLANGDVEFLGRVDFQTKIRGFRVEPEDIASALNQHSDIRDSYVLVSGEGAADKRLIAYFVARESFKPTTEELRSYLSTKLPAWMIPSAFEQVASLPLNANGKVDRNALPQLKSSRQDSNSNPVVISPLEAELVQIWESILQTTNIHVRDDFFELGGHSLLAVRMVAQIESVFGKKIPLSQVFSGPTIEKLAQVILDKADTESEVPLIEVKRGSRTPLFFLHGDILGGGLYCWNMARFLDADQALYVLTPQGLDGTPMLPTIQAMAEYHLNHIRRVQPHGPYSLGGTCAGALIAFEIAQRLRADNETVTRLILVDASAENQRFAWLSRIIKSLAWVSRQNAEQTSNLFHRWRNRAIKVRNSKFLSVNEKTDRAIPRLRDLFRPGLENTCIKPAPRAVKGPPTLAERHRALNDYLHLLEGYIPKAYSGKVHLLISSPTRGTGTDEREYWWRKIASNLRVGHIPGEHATFTSRNLPILTAHINEILASE